MAGVTDKLVGTLTTVEIVGTDHSEVVAAWLTTPPSTQMVWAVGRLVELEKDKQLPRPDVIASLRQKYGPNQVVPLRTWAFAINLSLRLTRWPWVAWKTPRKCSRP